HQPTMSFSNGAHYNLSVAGRPVNKHNSPSNQSSYGSHFLLRVGLHVFLVSLSTVIVVLCFFLCGKRGSNLTGLTQSVI
ncbi:MAG: hypothetical protein ACRDAR_14915, partial [Aeromonas veronii]